MICGVVGLRGCTGRRGGCGGEPGGGGHSFGVCGRSGRECFEKLATHRAHGRCDCCDVCTQIDGGGLHDASCRFGRRRAVLSDAVSGDRQFAHHYPPVGKRRENFSGPLWALTGRRRDLLSGSGQPGRSGRDYIRLRCWYCECDRFGTLEPCEPLRTSSSDSRPIQLAVDW